MLPTEHRGHEQTAVGPGRSRLQDVWQNKYMWHHKAFSGVQLSHDDGRYGVEQRGLLARLRVMTPDRYTVVVHVNRCPETEQYPELIASSYVQTQAQS
jgi:hypothetical protein